MVLPQFSIDFENYQIKSSFIHHLLPFFKAWMGIEPMIFGLRDQRLTTWPPCLGSFSFPSSALHFIPFCSSCTSLKLSRTFWKTSISVTWNSQAALISAPWWYLSFSSASFFSLSSVRLYIISHILSLSTSIPPSRFSPSLRHGSDAFENKYPRASLASPLFKWKTKPSITMSDHLLFGEWGKLKVYKRESDEKRNDEIDWGNESELFSFNC